MSFANFLRGRLTQDPRFSRVLHGCISALAGRGIAVVVTIVLLPLVLRYLGKEEFGIWITIRTSVLTLSVLDLDTALVVFSSDNLVITRYLGPAQVTQYRFAWRLTSYAAKVQAIMLPSLWPAFSKPCPKRQLDWVRSTYRSLTQKSRLAVAALALLVGMSRRFVIRVSAGPSAVARQTLPPLTSALNLVMAATTSQTFLLNATRRLKVEAVVAVVAAASNLALSVFLVQRIGPEGMVLSTILSFLLFMIVPQRIEVGRVLSGYYLPPPSGCPTSKVQLRYLYRFESSDSC